jgi:hypothetical protein
MTPGLTNYSSLGNRELILDGNVKKTQREADKD